MQPRKCNWKKKEILFSLMRSSLQRANKVRLEESQDLVLFLFCGGMCVERNREEHPIKESKDLF